MAYILFFAFLHELINSSTDHFALLNAVIFDSDTSQYLMTQIIRLILQFASFQRVLGKGRCRDQIKLSVFFNRKVIEYVFFMGYNMKEG